MWNLPPAEWNKQVFTFELIVMYLNHCLRFSSRATFCFLYTTLRVFVLKHLLRISWHRKDTILFTCILRWTCLCIALYRFPIIQCYYIRGRPFSTQDISSRPESLEEVAMAFCYILFWLKLISLIMHSNPNKTYSH